MLDLWWVETVGGTGKVTPVVGVETGGTVGDTMTSRVGATGLVESSFF